MLIKKLLFTTSVNACLLFLFLAPINNISAQLKIASALVKQDTTETSMSIIDSLGLRTGTIIPSNERRAKSGNFAMLLSAILPGAGQIYAHRYYTIPLIWGFGAYFTSRWIKADNTYRDFKRRYAESVPLDTVNHIGNLFLQGRRDDWRNYRDGFAFYLVITYLLNIVDAYVGAVLYDFDVSDNLGRSTEIRFRIPLH